MNDFERLLKDSLRTAGEGYSPRDPAAARERFLARRRRRRIRVVLAGTGFATVAAVAAFLFITAEKTVQEPQRVPPAASDDRATVTASIKTGDEPSGVAVGADSVWVTNVASNTVTKIDPATREVDATFTVRGGPDDVAVTEEAVWVTTSRGELWRLEPSDDEFLQVPEIGGLSGHLDIAAEGPDLFVQVDDGPLLVVGENADVGRPYEVAAEATDVAVHGDLVWVYERSAQRVVRFDRETGDRLGVTPVGDAASQDLAATDGSAWFFRGSDATLIQISAADGSTLQEVQLSGTFGALSPAPDGVWVMTASSESGAGNLYRVKSNRAEEIRTPILLGGLPYDVAAGPDGIWITNHDVGTVTRIDLVPDDESQPTQPGSGAQVIFFYSRAGDVFAFRADGSSEPVAATAALEGNPVISSSGKTLLYQEEQSPERSRIMLVALEDEIYSEGSREVLLDGEWPALSPTGELAWVEPGDSTTATRIGVGAIASEPRLVIDVPPPGRLNPVTAARLAWAASGEQLLFETEFESAEIEGRTLYSIDVASADTTSEPVQLSKSAPGEVLVSPADHPELGTSIIRLCCGSDQEPDFTTAELGVLTDDGFEPIMALEDLGLIPGPSMFAVPAGTLEYEETTGWSNGSTPSWMVGDGDRLFLVSSEGEADVLSLDGVTSAAVVPGALTDE